ncbi:MAG: hypothetical protein ACREQC_03625 [Candidatus Binataceae bacterium]
MGIRIRSAIVVAAAGAMLMGVGAPSRAFAGTPSGNLNLRMEGYELVTPSSGSPHRVDIDAIGQLIADTSGTFTGAETYTAINPAVPPGSEPEDVCAGTIAGAIGAPAGGFASGTGEFTLTSTYTPSSGSSGASCFPSTVTLLCNRTLINKKNTNDLNAGQYHCLATNVAAGAGASATVNGASIRGNVASVSGNNAPTD